MFRAASHILSVRALLYRRHPVNFQIASITRFPPSYKYENPKERDTCLPPCPPPPPPPKDDRLFWGAMTLICLAGGFVVYAKGSPEVRDWLTINAPWIDDAIAVLYEENMTYTEFTMACVEDAKRYIANFTSDNKPKQCSLAGGPVLNFDVPQEPKEQKEEPTCDPALPNIVTQGICEIEKCMIDLGDTALQNFETAKAACVYYNSLVEETMQNFNFKDMKALRPAMMERLNLVKESLCNAASATSKLDEMVRYLDCGIQASKDQINNSKAMHREFRERLKVAFVEYERENDKSIALDRQWQLVEDVILRYTSENEAMYAGLSYDAKVPSINGDIDIILYNSYRYIKKLNENLKDASEAMTDRVNRAMNTLPHCNEKDVKARAASLEVAVKKKRGEVEKDLKKREDDQKARNDKNFKDLFKKQLEKHEESLVTRVKQKEQEIMDKFDQMVVEKVTAETVVFHHQLDDMALKLKAVEDKLNARLKAEKETRRSQELWSAGASLLEATKKGDPYVKVDKELKAIEKASGDEDKLVKTVLKSIPDSVWEKGVVPESVLRERFNIMEKTARSVALVEQDGAYMPVYMLSWLQGLMLFMRVSGIPQAEFEKPPVEPPTHLDTFDLLQRARFWMERGNLPNALLYISSLQGASQAAAAKWHEAATAHLEVRQAAEAVLAHAAAMGLQYI